MKYSPSIIFNEMSGSAKGVTASKTLGRLYIRNKGTGGSARTLAQSIVKSIFKQLTQKWKSLSDKELTAWNELAKSQTGKRVLGNTCQITGANLFTRLNFWILRCGREMLTTPPALKGIESPSTADCGFKEGKLEFAFDPLLSNIPEDLKLVIMVSPPQSLGVSNAYGKCVQLGAVREISNGKYDLTAEYTAAYGEFVEGSQRIFCKYFFVNPQTGEKSAEMKAIGY